MIMMWCALADTGVHAGDEVTVVGVLAEVREMTASVASEADVGDSAGRLLGAGVSGICLTASADMAGAGVIGVTGVTGVRSEPAQVFEAGAGVASVTGVTGVTGVRSESARMLEAGAGVLSIWMMAIELNKKLNNNITSRMSFKKSFLSLWFKMSH